MHDHARRASAARFDQHDPLHRRLYLAWHPQRLPAGADVVLAAVRDVYARQADHNPAYARWWSEHGWAPSSPAGATGP